MALFSYIVAHDTGFAPNPFWGYCTLATCKPAIRRTAKPGDWIVGLTSKARHHKIVYFMKVEEIVALPDYFSDPRFRQKKPDFHRKALRHRCGDNIYEPLANGQYRQLQSTHSMRHGKGRSPGPEEDATRKAHDLSGKNVLISKCFAYFGADAVELPKELDAIVPGRGHKCRFTGQLVADFATFAASCEKGIHTHPFKWRLGDTSWRPCSH